MSETNIKFCPNCGGDTTELKDNRLLCMVCNVTYKIEEDGSAKVVDTDPLEKIRKGILDDVDKKIDDKLAGKTEPAAGEEPAGPADDPDELNDGFFG